MPRKIAGKPSQTFGTTNKVLAAQREQTDLRVFDERQLYLEHGPLTHICMRTGGWWCPAMMTQYGSGEVNEYGGSKERLYDECLGLAEDERITKIGILSGWWIDGLLIETNKKLGPVRIGGNGGKAPSPENPAAGYTVLTPPQPGAYVASFTLYVGTPILTGLQVHWGLDVPQA